MRKLTLDFENLLQNDTYQLLSKIIKCFYKGIPSHEKNKTIVIKHMIEPIPQHERPQWMSYFTSSQEDITKILTEITKTIPPKDLFECFKLIKDWLENILALSAPLIPNITKQTAGNLALGSPLMLWLFNVIDDMDTACVMGLFLCQIKPLPYVFVRIPEFSFRFRDLVLPQMVTYHQKLLDGCKKDLPYYGEFLLLKE
jgi:hypothetical protein